jgi:hypothetical protein
LRMEMPTAPHFDSAHASIQEAPGISQRAVWAALICATSSNGVNRYANRPSRS